MCINRDALEEHFQELLDTLEIISDTVRDTQSVNLIIQVHGHVFNMTSLIQELADEFDLDVDVRTQIDLGA